MNQPAPWKTIAFTTTIFLLGGIAGAAIAFGLARHISPRPPFIHDMSQHLQSRLETKLELTPEQLQKVQPAIAKVSAEMQALHAETMKRGSKVMDDFYTTITNALTTGQMQKLEELKKARPDFPPRGSHPHAHRSATNAAPQRPTPP